MLFVKQIICYDKFCIPRVIASDGRQAGTSYASNILLCVCIFINFMVLIVIPRVEKLIGASLVNGFIEIVLFPR